MPNWGRKAKDEYKQAPNGLFKGILAGLGVAVLGALLWATFIILFEQVAVVIGAVIFVSIVKIMDKVGTKRTIPSILIAALIAVGSVFLGSYLTVLWLIARESFSTLTSFEALVFALTVAWEVMWADTRLLYSSITFCLIGVVLYLIPLWMNQNALLNRAFKPKVEVVGNKLF